jgi:DNA-binding CsgD family transcriptional regulator
MVIQRALTPRQSLILRNVARGMTNKDIARELGISEQGVKVHISRLLERYGAENRVELINLARAWPEGAQPSAFAEMSGQIAGIRAGLNQTYEEAKALGHANGGNGHSRSSATASDGDWNEAKSRTDLAAEVRSLHEVLAEINVALKLAREMPGTADVAPLVDAIRSRVQVALERSAKLDILVDRARQDGVLRQNAS